MLTPQQIQQIRVAAGAPPTPKSTGNQLSLSERLGISNAQPVQKDTFASNLKSDFERRDATVKQAHQNYDQGKISLPEGLLQAGGQAAGMAVDTVFEGIKALTPKPVKDAVGGAMDKVAGSAPIQNTVKAYEAWKAQHPRAAADLEAVGNIASILPVGAGAKVAGEVGGEVLQTSGKALQASAKASTEKSIADYALQLVKPEESKATKTAEVGRTTEKGFGPFKSSVVAPTSQEAKSAAEVAKIPGINPRATLQQNYNVIKNYNTSLSERLKADLVKNDFVFPKKELMSRLNVVKQTLAENPSLVGDTAKTADKLVNQFSKLVMEAPAKGSSLLQVRKDFDRLVESQKGAKVFDPKNETAFTIALREIRQTANNFLDEKATNVAVKDSLHAQNALYNAMDNIAPKAAYEANNAFGRALQRVGGVLGTKNKVVQTVAAIVGVGGLGAASMFAPVVAGVGIPAYLLFQGGKLVLRPGLRSAIGKLLETTGKVINPADKQILRDAYNGVLGDSSSSLGHSESGALRERPELSQSTTVKSQTSPNTTSNISSSVPQAAEKASTPTTPIQAPESVSSPKPSIFQSAVENIKNNGEKGAIKNPLYKGPDPVKVAQKLGGEDIPLVQDFVNNPTANTWMKLQPILEAEPALADMPLNKLQDFLQNVIDQRNAPDFKPAKIGGPTPLRNAENTRLAGSKSSVSDPEATIQRHVTSAKQVLDSMDYAGLKKAGGMKALLTQMKTNIVDGLKAEGNPTAAKAIERLDPNIYPNPDTFQTAASRLVKSPKAQGAAPSTDMTQLAKEAQKYKSAEEFVKAQPTLYHGNSTEGAFKLGDQPTFLTADKAQAGKFANDVMYGQQRGGIGRVIDFSAVPGKSKTITIPENIGYGIDGFVKKESAIAKKEGYRYLDFTHPVVDMNLGEFPVKVSLYPKEDLMTKSQLTDFYNKVTGKK